MNEDLPSYLAGLNPEQLQAVRHEGSPLLILAGAGSGKTRVITTKIAWLVRERGMSPESILAVTFTNKAAREMRERAESIEPACSRAVIRTFHSFGAWFLRRNALAAGLDSNFTIYDDDDSAVLLQAVLPSRTRQECNRLASRIARAKDFGLEPDSPDLERAFPEPEFRRTYAAYQDRLKKTGNVDFGDLIRLPARLLASEPAIAKRTQQRFRVILVDEYQDSNVAQFRLLRLLAGPETYICVVGDDDQSIYRFRGAEVRNILNFAQVFPGTTTIKLERNYRSYQSILDLAGDVVSHNSGRLGKTLRAMRPGGEKPLLALLDDQEQEVQYCTSIVKSHLAKGGNLSDIAILYRTNAQSLAFEKDFPRMGIRYRIVGALRFYDREEVKDVLSYLSLILNPRDEIAFKRVANKPARGIGDTGLETVLDAAARSGEDLLTAAGGCIDELRGRGKAGMKNFLAMIHGFRKALGLSDRMDAQGDPDARENRDDTNRDDTNRDDTNRAAPGEPEPYSISDGGTRRADPGTTSLGELLQALIRETGLAEYHKGQDEIAGTQKLSNLEELVNAASLYPLGAEGLAEFLETIELDRSLQAADPSESAEAVTLITMHNTKGLEFPVVIVTGMEQGLFPRDDEEGEDLEEQRRLFYVAVTRAKNRLFLTACRWRRIHGRLFETVPSRFLSEIKPELFDARGAGGKATSSGPNPYAARPGYGRASYSPPPQGNARISQQSGTRPDMNSQWRAGATVYHDEYGPGMIVKVSPTPSSGPLVVVRFESGKLAQFFPKFTSKLERVKE
ncbi:MAG: UvrD-helicase domain-containing protein [Rectinemataceae bacterium]